MRIMPTWPAMALVRRELLTLLRTKRAFWMLVVMLGFAIFVTAGVWPSGVMDPNALPHIARRLISIISLVFMGASLLFVPGLAAVGFTTEKDARTFEMLKITLITPRGIVLGKLANVLGYLALLLISALPILGVIFFVTGVDWIQVTVSLGLIAATALSSAAAGLLCSAYFRRTVVARVMSYVLAVFLTGFPFMITYELINDVFRIDIFNVIKGLLEPADPLYILQIPFGREIRNIINTFLNPDWIFCTCSPQLCMQRVLRSARVGGWHVGIAAGYQLVWTLLFLGMARRVILRPAKPPKVDQEKPIDDVAALVARRKKFPYYLADPLRRKKVIEDDRNPMYVREVRWGVLGKTTRLVRVFYTALILYGFTLMATVFTAVGWHFERNAVSLFIMVQGIFMAVVAPMLLANTLAKECDQGNMEFLRTTLLSPAEIVLGKVKAGFFAFLPVWCASAITSLVLIAFLAWWRALAEGLPYLLAGWGTLATCTVLSMGIGIYASARAKHTNTALAVSYFLSIMMYLGGMMVVSIILELSRDAYGWQFDRYWREGVYSFMSPIAAYVYNVSGGRYWSENRFPLNPYWLGNVLTFTSLGLFLIWRAIRRFEWVHMGGRERAKARREKHRRPARRAAIARGTGKRLPAEE